MTEAEGLSDALTLETARLRNELSELNRLGESFGSSITRAFASAITDGRRLSDVLRGLALSLADRALTAACGHWEISWAASSPSPMAASSTRRCWCRSGAARLSPARPVPRPSCPSPAGQMVGSA